MVWINPRSPTPLPPPASPHAGGSGRWCVLVAALFFAAPATATATVTATATAAGAVLRPDAQAAILALLGDVGFERRAASGAIVDHAQIARDRVVFGVHAGDQRENDPPLVRVLLLPLAEASAGDQRSASFAVQIARDDGALAARAASDRDAATALTTRIVANIIANDHGGLYRDVQVQQEHRPRAAPPGDVGQLTAATLAVWLALLLALLAYARAGLLARPFFVRQMRLTHLLPALLQCLLFAYWGLYWREFVPRVLPMLALEVAFAVAVDLLFGLARQRRLVLGVGALPIALSTNLFVVFPPGGAFLTLMAITIALASKHFVRLPRGHLFNPSALGLSVVGLLTMVAPALGSGDTAAEFSLMPNGTAVVLLLALVVQLRLGVAVISIGAALGLGLAAVVLGGQVFDPGWAPVTLVITLLITDPATSPRDPLERLLFGVVAGLAMRTLGEVFIVTFDNDFYGKVSAVLLANLAVPQVAKLRTWIGDRVGERRLERVVSLLSLRWRWAHIAVLWLLVLGGNTLGDGKAQRFEAYDTAWQAHIRNRTPLLEPGPTLTASCAHNPLFCREFSVFVEATCWFGSRDARCGPGIAGHQRDVPAAFLAPRTGPNHRRP